MQFRRLPTDRPIHVLIDSTGLRVHVGHVQEPPRYRAWRKLHLAVGAETGEIVVSDLTDRRTHDCTQVPPLLEQISDPIASVSAGGKAICLRSRAMQQRRWDGSDPALIPTSRALDPSRDKPGHASVSPLRQIPSYNWLRNR
ncbi:MAG: transposase [Longimicrobiales bacterium]